MEKRVWKTESKSNVSGARLIFKNYSIMKAKVQIMKKSLEDIERTAEQELNDDIYSASVSHPTENTGIHSSNTTGDKIPNIVMHLAETRKENYKQVTIAQKRVRMLERAIHSVDIFIGALDEEHAEIIRRAFLLPQRENNAEIGKAVSLSESRVKQIIFEELCKYNSVVPKYERDKYINEINSIE